MLTKHYRHVEFTCDHSQAFHEYVSYMGGYCAHVGERALHVQALNFLGVVSPHNFNDCPQYSHGLSVIFIDFSRFHSVSITFSHFQSL